MGHFKKTENKDRRWFLSLFTATDKKTGNPEKVKMLTPDGKLVEVDKAILDKLTNQKKASNQQIYDWMENPSKENNI